MDKEKLEKAAKWARAVSTPGMIDSLTEDEVVELTEIVSYVAEIVLEKYELESRVVEVPVSPAMVKISVDDKSYTMEEIQAIIREVNQKANAKIYKHQPMGPPIEVVNIGGEYFTMDEAREMMKEGDSRV